MKKVSVIIPMHNASNYIIDCLNSVVSQTYKNLEIILIDDHSNDDTLKKVSLYNDKRIKLIKNKVNCGAAITRNKGIEAATGDYICFIDCDDLWVNDKIEKQVKFIKDKAFIYSKYYYLRKTKTHLANVPLSYTYESLLKNSGIFTSTVMLNMEYLTKEDIYMPNIKRGQDYACWYQILKKVGNAYGMDDALAYYRVGNVSLSSNKFKAAKRTWDLYKSQNIMLPKRLVCFICYAFNAVKRRI